MSRKHFGTDGVRGIANEGLTPEFAFRLGSAAGRTILSHGWTPRVVVGRDTRRSGPMLGASLASGFCSVGVDVVVLGVVPTPTVSFVARTGDFGLGAIVSASHNPARDNGIKFVRHDGKKTPDEVEEEIEGLLEVPVGVPVTGGNIGWLDSSREEIDAYIAFLVSLVPERLEGMRVALDAAHGAAHDIAPAVLKALGAEVVAVGVNPDGSNINAEGGATKPSTICSLTQETKADAGVAFDGDADRAVFADSKGRLVNGDRTIGLWMQHWMKAGRSMRPVAVGTVMSNGGLGQYLESIGVALERTPVGDKYVSQRIEDTGAPVGGEQSGHIIFPNNGPTGDGIATMLEVLRVLKRENVPLEAHAADYEPWPQKLVNVEVSDRATWNSGVQVRSAIASAEETLGDMGRVVVRASGTQPMVRVMVEATDAGVRDQVVSGIVTAMQKEAGGIVYSEVDLTHALGD